MAASNSSDRGFTWSDEETLLLLGIWGSKETQSELDDCKRNFNVYEKISRYLQNIGYNRSASQCREKIKRLKREYTITKHYNQRLGARKKTMRFYERIESIINYRRSLGLEKFQNNEKHSHLLPILENKSQNIQQCDTEVSSILKLSPSVCEDYNDTEVSEVTVGQLSPSNPELLDVNYVPYEAPILRNNENVCEQNLLFNTRRAEDDLIDALASKIFIYQEKADNIFMNTLYTLEERRIANEEELQKLWINFEETGRKEEQKHEMDIIMMIAQLFKQNSKSV